MKHENIKYYSEVKFQRISRMKPKTFGKAIEILNAKYEEEHFKNTKKVLEYADTN